MFMTGISRRNESADAKHRGLKTAAESGGAGGRRVGGAFLGCSVFSFHSFFLLPSVLYSSVLPSRVSENAYEMTRT